MQIMIIMMSKNRNRRHETEEKKDGFAAATVENQPRDAGQRFRAQVCAAQRQT
jgi:hypothetical protein